MILRLLENNTSIQTLHIYQLQPPCHMMELSDIWISLTRDTGDGIEMIGCEMFLLYEKGEKMSFLLMCHLKGTNLPKMKIQILFLGQK